MEYKTDKKWLFSMLFAVLFCTASPCTIEPGQQNENTEQEVWLTIFVHGIMSVKHHLSLTNIIRFMKDEIDDSLYAATVNCMREDPFFFKNQPMQELGLKTINPSDASVGNASSLLARLMDQVIHATYSPDIKNYFYTFGWSGLLSPSKRYREAKKLYIALSQEIKLFKQQGITPRIRLIGYSHGGNICLNLGAVKKHENLKKENISIDQLVLLGVPVQYDTDYLVSSPLFKKVYHFYSHADRIQRLDFFSWNRFLSKRLFKEREGFTLPHRLTQIRIKARRTAAQKSEAMFITNNFGNPAIVSGSHKILKNADPGHTELWFFGWTPSNYRETFPLYPLPIVLFVPVLIKYIDEAKATLPCKDNIVTVDFRPEQEKVIIKGKGRKHIIKPLVPDRFFEDLKAQAWPIKPENYDQAVYDECVKRAREQAQQSIAQNAKK